MVLLASLIPSLIANPDSDSDASSCSCCWLGRCGPLERRYWSSTDAGRDRSVASDSGGSDGDDGVAPKEENGREKEANAADVCCCCCCCCCCCGWEMPRPLASFPPTCGSPLKAAVAFVVVGLREEAPTDDRFGGPPPLPLASSSFVSSGWCSFLPTMIASPHGGREEEMGDLEGDAGADADATAPPWPVRRSWSYSVSAAQDATLRLFVLCSCQSSPGSLFP
mmetsp:Transcript_3161/g.8918  ORF Transcript_3161/g.8918 Transcript_3161/m.8918 type:complete len:223 (-) Transcript_3161:1135-1803(-)